MAEKRRKTATLNLRIDPNLKDAAEKWLSDWRRERRDVDGEQLCKRQGKR
ncbi:MAG: hypothetical protein L0H73_03610 [Nitrococcus sp.]|nr:hypothetical protein [Nitrococcus sp.]